ncbi:MAG: hypothetical protein H0V18_13005 [Pyrinomonadaceae bacterium]|nr:hypothetical protein [Pyrinomonadaceae bacterium]
MAGAFGATDEDGPERLDGDGADAVRRAVRSAKVDLIVGAEDDLLRDVASVNRPVTVDAPENSRPANQARS